VFGEDAFRTGTGVHAAAIVKAQAKGDAWLADRVYSGVPAGWFGMSQKIEISPMSGISNVRYWLNAHGLNGADDGLANHVFEAAKRCDHTFTDAEVLSICAAYSDAAAAPVAEAAA
jgi:2-isopropylmalate synthase